MKKWKYALSSADAAPDTAPILLCGDVTDNLLKASELGYDAIEVHIRETAKLDYENIKAAEKKTGTKVAMVVTGRLNTEGKCNLMDDSPYVNKAALEGMKKYIDMASKLDADIVIGWVKGNVNNENRREKYMNHLAENLKILDKYGEKNNVKLNLEVINRYEVNVFKTAKETVDFIEKYNLNNCYVHLDTFHMNIEESDPIEAIRLCGNKLGYFHLADNNRKYPGNGQINFENILRALEDINYDGYLSIECLPYPDRKTAALNSINYLKSIK